MQQMKVILASASPRRRELMTQIGIEYEVKVSHKEEDVTTSDPVEACKALSKQKAMDIADQELENDPTTECLIIGADTVVAVDGLILGKPADRADAERMLRHLSGKAHQVHTGVTVVHLPDGEATSFVATTHVEVAELSNKDMDWYLSTDEPYDKAGAYGIQGYFGRYVTGIRGDYNNVVGLPVGQLYRDCLSRYGL
ncbi:MAG: septum formation protein Maf [Lachnospiraceae bacterium]|nr:septum formation protein Maf [Candidatus Equihabitans merdae]